MQGEVSTLSKNIFTFPANQRPEVKRQNIATCKKQRYKKTITIQWLYKEQPARFSK